MRPLIDKLKVATIEGDVQTDSDVRDKLLEIGSPALPALLDLFKDPSIEFRQAACLALSDFLDNYPRVVIPALIDAANDEDEKVREEACRVLDEPGPEVEAAVTALTQALRDRAAGVRERAAMSLGRIGTEARSAVPSLCELLRDPNAGVRLEALRALRRLDVPLSRELVPTLIQLMENDGGYAFRYSVPPLLAKLDPEAAAVGLIRMFRDENKDVRAWASESVWRIGAQDTNARIIVPLLVEAMKADDPRARTAAAQALQRIDPEEAKTVGFDDGSDDPTNRGYSNSLNRLLERRLTVQDQEGKPAVLNSTGRAIGDVQLEIVWTSPSQFGWNYSLPDLHDGKDAFETDYPSTPFFLKKKLGAKTVLDISVPDTPYFFYIINGHFSPVFWDSEKDVIWQLKNSDLEVKFQRMRTASTSSKRIVFIEPGGDCAEFLIVDFSQGQNSPRIIYYMEGGLP